MYVCNCNGVRGRDVDAAIAAGARSARDVLAKNAAEPCCGQCLPDIAQLIEEAQGAAAQEGVLVAAE